MDQPTANSLVKIASLLRADDAEAERAISIKFLNTNSDHEQAWIILSFVVQTRDRQMYALCQTLWLNPTLVKAGARLAELMGESVKLETNPAWEKVKKQPFTPEPAPA